MSYRFMRLILFFDLPVETAQNRRDYAHFRKFLLKSGFIRMQESVYSKLALNQTVLDGICENVRKNKPPAGLIQMLTITEKQFAKIEFVLGESTGDVISTDERYIEL